VQKDDIVFAPEFINAEENVASNSSHSLA